MPIFLAVPRPDMAIPWKRRRHTPVMASNHVFTYAAHPVYAQRIENIKEYQASIQPAHRLLEF